MRRTLLVGLFLLLPVLLAAGDASAKRRLSPPRNTGLPVISGTAQVGATLTTSAGTWSGSTPLTFGYQWRRCDAGGGSCTNVGSNAAWYPPVTSDAGSTIRVVVTATNGAGSSSAQSNATGVVQAGPPPPPPASGLHVAGNLLLDSKGATVHLHGVNRSGPEYACIQGWGIFDGPSDAASVAAMAAWHVNVVRVPLNEDCWLGINGVGPAYGGASYRNAIVAFVNLLHSYGIYAELSLMWAAPGTNQATYQPAAPDEDHAPAMWSSLAQTFASDPNVILAPWGEPTVSADCILNGGNCGATFGSSNTPYTSAGMQQAVNVMRQSGYQGVIAIPGIDYANDLSEWLSHEPVDPLGQLVAEAHVYGKNACDTTSCLDTNYGPVAARFPVIFGETGETYDATDCGSSYISTFMNWADAHGVGYEAWVWDAWGNCSALIADYSGTPYSAYGTWVRSHYLSLP